MLSGLEIVNIFLEKLEYFFIRFLGKSKVDTIKILLLRIVSTTVLGLES